MTNEQLYSLLMFIKTNKNVSRKKLYDAFDYANDSELDYLMYQGYIQTLVHRNEDKEIIYSPEDVFSINENGYNFIREWYIKTEPIELARQANIKSDKANVLSRTSIGISIAALLLPLLKELFLK